MPISKTFVRNPTVRATDQQSEFVDRIEPQLDQVNVDLTTLVTEANILAGRIVVPVTVANVATAAPANAELGYDPASGKVFYVDGGGLWRQALTPNVSPNGTTYTSAANGQLDFVVNGTPVGNVTISGGMPKWTLSGALDPTAYAGTAVTVAQRNALTPVAGWLVYVKDVGAALNEYQLWDGTTWKSVGSAAVAPNRLFLSNTLVAPAVAGQPTLAEITAAVGANRDTLAYYTGDNLSASAPTFIYWVDGAGAVTLLRSPASAGLALTATAAVADGVAAAGVSAQAAHGDHVHPELPVTSVNAAIAVGGSYGHALTWTADPAGGLQAGVAGAGVKVDATTPGNVTLSVGANGLKATYTVPADLHVTGIVAAVTPGHYTVQLSDGSTFDANLTALLDAPLPAAATPLADTPAGAVGIATKYAREDHAHPREATTNALTAASGAITSTVDGVASALTPGAGTIAAGQLVGFDAGGALVHGADPTPTTHTVTAASADTVTSTVNGTAAPLAPAAGTIASGKLLGFDASGALVKGADPTPTGPTTNTLVGTGSAITSTVNGTAASVTPAAGTIAAASLLGFDAGGNLVKGADPTPGAPTTNTLTGTTGDTVTSTVNGTAATITPAAGTVASGKVLGFNAAGALVKGTDPAITAHTALATGAHAASAISVAPTGNISSTTVQAALVEHQGDIDLLAAGAVFKGAFDASSGSFPGGGLAQPGWWYVTTVAGTVSGQAFIVGDYLYANAVNASTATFAGNWVRVTGPGTSNLFTTAAGSLTTTVNGVAASVTPAAGTIATGQVLGFNAGGTLVKGPDPTATTNTITAASGGAITSTVNGTAAALTPPAGTITVGQVVGFDASGALVHGADPTPAPATTNTLAAAGGALTSTVNGTASTVTPTAGTIAATKHLGFDAGGNLVTDTVAAGNPFAFVTTKGDLPAGTGAGAVTRLGAGTNGQILVADSSQPTGLRWSAAPSATGAVYAGVVPNAVARLALADSPGQTAWQSDGGGPRHRGGMYQQIRTPASSGANWVLIGEQLYSATADGTLTTADMTTLTADVTA